MAQRGIAVRIFDAKQAAREASWAGAGMLAPGGEIDQPSPLLDYALNSLRLWPEFVRELELESGIRIDYRRSGGLEVALTDDEAELLAAKAARQAALGIASEPAHHNGSPARFYPDDAVVDPRDVTRALLQACRNLAVELHEHEPVLDVSPEGRWIRTAQARYEDSHVLIAAGAWSSELLRGVPAVLPAAYPVRGHLIAFSLAPGMLNPILRNGHTYLLQRESGLLIAGVSTEVVGFDRTLDPVALEEIRAKAARLLPALASLEPSESWNGFRPGADSEAPVVTRVPGTGILTAFGHYRNGILLAPETASRVASLID